jgi:HD superfamily phosphodiesterase
MKYDWEKLDNLCLKYYIDRDPSHGIDHIMSVLDNLDLLLKSHIQPLSHLDQTLARVSALLHDAYDPKYVEDPSNIKKTIRLDLLKFGLLDIEVDIIFTVIKNVSFTREKTRRNKGNKIILNDRIMVIRNLVSDSDKLEAIGIDSITRMIQYREELGRRFEQEYILDKIFTDVREQCRERCYILLTDNYIKTEKAREIAEKKIEKMKKIVDDDEMLANFILKYLGHV